MPGDASPALLRRAQGVFSIVDYPDPTVTASVYADRQLDAVLLAGVVPFWYSWMSRRREATAYLWSVRYSRGGEHLKLRLHGPRPLVDHLGRELGDRLERCLGELGPPEPVERRNRPDAPAVDEEDDRPLIHPDRTLLWTHYRRSHVTLGPRPWLQDDRYAALFTRSLAAGFELFLESLSVPDAASAISHRIRQTTVLKGLIGGIGALGFGDRPGAYLAYHRDWLLRFFVRDAGRERDLRERFEARLQGMAAARAQLRAVAALQWARSAPAKESRAAADWRSWLGRLAAHVGAQGGEPESLTDPFTSDPLFPPAFKLFHGLANQVGLSPLDEAFLHHLLLRSAAVDEPAEAGGAVAQG